MILTFKYRLKVTTSQDSYLECMLREQRDLYNAALEERIDCYRKTKRALSYFDQTKELSEWRHCDSDAERTSVQVQRWTLKKVDNAFKAFFKRLKNKDGKVGFPRFKSINRWRSFGFNEFKGVTIKDSKLNFSGLLNPINVRIHRPLPNGKIKTCVFTKDHKGWFICLFLGIRPRNKRLTNKCIGIDAGIASLMSLSNGEHIENIKPLKRVQRQLRLRQRALSRCKRDSNRRQKIGREVTKLYVNIRNSRRTYLHQVSRKIINDYDIVAIENLNIKGLILGNLSQNIQDAGWGILFKMLRYKAERAGVRLIEVDPKNTSQLCSGCGAMVPKDLKVRTHGCPHCGLVLDRDVNAARNILHRAVESPEFDNVIRLDVRRTRSANTLLYQL